MLTRIKNAYGCIKRLGPNGYKLAKRTLSGKEVPFFGTRKYWLMEKAFERIRKWGIAGDYFEFGLYQGRAFLSAHELKDRFGLDMHLYGFDSFEGLPEFSGRDADYDVFHPGQYACSVDEFRGIMNFWGVPEVDYTLIKGFFDSSLISDEVKELKTKKCAVAYIDCDLYDSTVPVLDYLTSFIGGGSIIIFDDWFSFGGDPHSGQIRAVREWEERNEHFKLLEYHRFNNQVMFLVQDWREHK